MAPMRAVGEGKARYNSNILNHILNKKSWRLHNRSSVLIPRRIFQVVNYWIVTIIFPNRKYRRTGRVDSFFFSANAMAWYRPCIRSPPRGVGKGDETEDYSGWGVGGLGQTGEKKRRMWKNVTDNTQWGRRAAAQKIWNSLFTGSVGGGAVEFVVCGWWRRGVAGHGRGCRRSAARAERRPSVRQQHQERDNPRTNHRT